MHLSLKRAAFAVGVVATVIGFGAASSMAATTFTVKIGSTATGSGTYTAATTGTSPQITLKDTTSGTTLNCASGTAAGAVPHLGSGLINPLATITSTTWNTCSGPFGLVLNVAQQNVWNINGVSYNSANGGVTTGYVNNVTAKITSSTCNFTVTGAADATFTNTGTNAQILALAAVAGSGHTLSISAVSGCFGVVANGDTATFAARYLVSAKVGTTPGALTITSP